jgi:methyltransferase family protein
VVVPPPPPRKRQGIPSMITGAEAEYFARCAERCAPLSGKIVDLGCWMGATAVALANGVHRSGSQDRVLALDIFLWCDWMNDGPSRRVHCIYHAGDSFLPEARRVVKDHGHGLVDLVEADVAHHEWTREKIKLLLVDARKTPALMKQIARCYFPSLVPGGLLLHQDFKHHFTPWIHVLQYRLRKCFRFLESVEHGGTVGFEVLQTPSLAEVLAAIRMANVAPTEVDAAFAYSLSILPESEHAEIAQAHVTHYCRHRQLDDARRVAADYLARGVDSLPRDPKAASLLPPPDSTGDMTRPIAA